MAATFFKSDDKVYLVESDHELNQESVARLAWLLGAEKLEDDSVSGTFIGPRREMVSPWSTNASEIALISGVAGVSRIEAFEPARSSGYDPMLQAEYNGLTTSSLVVEGTPQATFSVDDIGQFNEEASLALSDEEVSYLEGVSSSLGRKFTDAELFAFAQINSEHCRHKIFNGSFTVDGKACDQSLFQLIKETSKRAPNSIVSAYSDNVAFLKGPQISQFSPDEVTRPGFFEQRTIDSVLSLKAETHNFPTTVEPFYGASTGGGGEIRDRMAGGTGSIPLIGTAVYMTAYPRLDAASRPWENYIAARDWKYQRPEEILVKASNGASDFGNKFGQPLICGSVSTFEMQTSRALYAYDRCIMLAGGVGYANAEHAHKLEPAVGDKLVLLGGENYRIGMAGGSVSSVDTGVVSQELELSAVQRANPEMQKRVFNAIRALVEIAQNPIKLIHDHGAGGHINCFSELLEKEGGRIYLDKLPVGDPTLSATEIICNESQERMGLIVAAEDISLLEEIAERERAPLYVVGEVTGSGVIEFVDGAGNKPIDFPVEYLFGSTPQTELQDENIALETSELVCAIDDAQAFRAALEQVLSLESVACKDWLTNKVDRCVSGRVALQQCTGVLQLPLNNVGVVSLDYSGIAGIATAIGHASGPGIIDPEAGSTLSVAEALTNLVWAPIEGGLDAVALSANWMWPAKQAGEDARLYRAVSALSEFSIALGIPVPTGKDSLSMTMNYANGSKVLAPGTVIVSALAPVSDVRRCVTPELKSVLDSSLVYIDCSGMDSHPLGASAYAQTRGEIGREVPTVVDVKTFGAGFNALQELIAKDIVCAGHDVSSGGLITCLCEMAFTGSHGIEIALDSGTTNTAQMLFCEKPGVVLQIEKENVDAVIETFRAVGLATTVLGSVNESGAISLSSSDFNCEMSVAELRRCWFKPSQLLDVMQTEPSLAKERFETLGKHPLNLSFPANFTGRGSDHGVDFNRANRSDIVAAVIREKGTNGEREMAFSLFAAGFDVKDVTMSDLIAGRETLEDVRFIAFPGGFSNSDVLGSSHGWAGAFRYNARAYDALMKFYERPDTLSLGVCNGCQLMVDLDLVYPEHDQKIAMLHNRSGKFESAFVGVEIAKTNSIMLRGLQGAQLGVWVAHGEGCFSLPASRDSYDIALEFSASEYPANPNGSDHNAAGIVSNDGRHLVMMPHLERSLLPRNWGHYPYQRRVSDEFSPWMLAFTSAYCWCQENR